ncbi:MAG TPA: phage tail sheath subtilisin-like domain-containing protein [Cellvibrio sp.]|nr:phage tail sheath subtilisin-like domain-containing protein [Cellvibrio sp.]
MPEYLAPGVFVEEVSFRSKSIEGVGTSVAAIAGPTRYGPVRGAPEVITSYNEYERIYGDPGSLAFGEEIHLNYTALAARAFFENGGKQLFVTRVVNGGNDTDTNGAGSTAGTAGVAEGGLSIEARFPGSGGNFDIEVIWEDAQNLLKSRNYPRVDEIPQGSIGLLVLENIEANQFLGTVSHEGNFPLLRLTILVEKTATGFTFLEDTKAQVTNTAAEDADPVTEFIDVAALGTGVTDGAATERFAQFRVTYAAQPASGPLADNTPAELVLNEAVDIAGFTGLDLGGNRIIRGVVDADGLVFALPEIEPGNNSFDLAVLAIAPNAVKSLHVLREFSLDVIRRKIGVDDEGTPGKGEVVYRAAGLSLDSERKNFVSKVLRQNPEKKLDGLTQPIAVEAEGSIEQLHTALFTLFDADLLNPGEGSFDDPRYIIVLEGGTDGNLPIAIDYAGETDEQQGSTGLAALEEIEDIAIVMTPAAANDPDNHQAVVSELLKHCVKMRYRIGLVDSRENMSLSEVRAFRDNFDDSRLALYTPWVVTSDPTGQSQTINLPPSGFMSGIYARTDVDFGVHKAPANTPVLGALRFEQDINKFQQELLNPNGINCLRSFAGRGHRVWGGRTLSSDPEWKYVNVRRYFLYLERSIDKGTQWAVFEPNGEKLWANVVTTVESFLFNEWKNGRLLGSKPASAYFVRCDRSTMTQNDIDNGRLICEVGVAPLRPAEFVVFRIGQKTADA